MEGASLTNLVGHYFTANLYRMHPGWHDAPCGSLSLGEVCLAPMRDSTQTILNSVTRTPRPEPVTTGFRAGVRLPHVFDYTSICNTPTNKPSVKACKYPNPTP